jgi:hypothetical protein
MDRNLEQRLRDLERWSAAAEAQIERSHERAAALEPVVAQLQKAAEAQATITAAREARRRNIGQYVSVASGLAACAALALRVRA